MNETKRNVSVIFFERSKKFEGKTAFKYFATKNSDAFIIVLLRCISRGINLKLARKKENLIKCNSPLRRKLLSADAARVRNLSVKDKSRAQDDLIWAIVVAHYKVLPSFFFLSSPPPFPFFLFFFFADISSMESFRERICYFIHKYNLNRGRTNHEKHSVLNLRIVKIRKLFTLFANISIVEFRIKIILNWQWSLKNH